MGSNKENELNKLRRAIEDQRMKAEREVLEKPQISGEGSYSYSGSNNALHNSPDAENVYPVFVSPDHDRWSSAASTVSGHSGHSSLSMSAGNTLTRMNADASPESSINKRVSSGSLSSVSSHISGSSSSTGSSGPEIEAAMKQSKKKRWLPLKSAFSKGSKSQSSSQPDLLDSEDSGCPLSPTLSRRNLHNTTGSVGSTSESEAIQELLQVVQEKERKLTDVRLEALTSQHQIHQLREQITQMQNEMQLLRLENERLQAENTRGSSTNGDERLVSPSHCSASKQAPLTRPASSGYLSNLTKTANKSGNRSLSCDQSPVTSPMHRTHYNETPVNSYSTAAIPALDCKNLQNTLSPDSENEGFQVKFVVTSSSTMLLGKRSVNIGSLPVPRRATWNELDHVSQSILTEYCRVVDGDTRLGLSASSIECYCVGDLRREIGGKTPDLLPCAYIVGNVDTVEIQLKDASTGCVDQMAFDMLISRDTLECYISMLLQNKRVILEGPSGTGKTAFAMSLAEYTVSRLRAEGGNTMVSVIDAKQDGEEKVQRYLADLFSRSKDVDSPSTPAVLVIENLHLLTSVLDTLKKLVPLTSQAKPLYVIGTMQPTEQNNSSQLSNFKWISCGCESPHVQRYLTRALRRSLVEHLLTSPGTCSREDSKLSSIVLWIPLCWQHVNRFLELQNIYSASLGPKMFLKCPMDIAGSCSWFVGIWNNSIIPYLASVLRTTRHGEGSPNWEDPSKWIINSFPWDISEAGIDPMKAITRLQSQDLEQLPRYPSQHDVIDGEYEQMPLPPPPPTVRSTYGESHPQTFRPPCATSSPIKTSPGGASVGISNRCLNNNNGTSQRDATNNVWQMQNGSATLNRASASSNNQIRHFSTLGSGSGKYSRVGNGKSAQANDPLKDMLAQLKHAALNPSEDFEITRSSSKRRDQY